MASEHYIFPYAPDERTRRSVMAAQAYNKTMDEVYQHDSRIKPSFDNESFSGALGTTTVTIEGLCLQGAKGWDEKQVLMPEVPRVSERLFGGASIAPIVGNDRATLSLFGPLENLELTLNKFLLGVHGWANKAKYFKEVARPFIVRSIENSTSEASTAKKLRKELDYVGPIEMSYVRSFEAFSGSMEEPILELRALGDFIASIVKDGDEISPPGSGHDRPSAKPTLPKPSPSDSSSHFAKILSPVAEASSSRQSIETKSASTLPTTSPHLNTILNPEPATQTLTGGPMKKGDTVDQRGSSAYADLLQAAEYNSGTNKSPSHSCSPPPSPSVWVNTLIKPFSLPWMKAEEHSLDSSSSLLLQPSGLHHNKRSPAPPGTPQWKIDLSDRKGHPIRILHVGPQELDILTKCLTLVHSATRKGEECMRVIIQNQALATEMEAEYKQWDEFCMDLEDNVSIDAREARQKTNEESGYTNVDDAKSKGKAKDPTLYGPPAHGSNTGFDTAADLRAYGRVDPGAPSSAWGYRKFEAPSSKAKAARRPALATHVEDPDETEDEEEEEEQRKTRGAVRDFGLGSQASTERVGSPMSVSDRTDGVEEVTNFEEAFGADDDDDDKEEGVDQEMEDVGEGEGQGQGLEQSGNAEEEDEGMGSGHDHDHEDDDGEERKKGSKSGEPVLGLYGEEL